MPKLDPEILDLQIAISEELIKQDPDNEELKSNLDDIKLLRLSVDK